MLEHIDPRIENLTDHLTEVALGCQRMLSENPRQPQALVGITLVALASRQNEAAVTTAKAAVAAAPKMGAAWVTLGQAHKAAGHPKDAEKAYRRAIRLDGMDPLARMGLGELKLASDQPEEAFTEFRMALARQPSLAGAQIGIGHALAFLGKDTEALDAYEKALTLQPRLPEAEFAAGFVQARMGGIKQAEMRYRRAIALRPDFAAAWMNLGALLREQEKDAYAEAALLRAVELRPDMISGWINLAILKRSQGLWDEAEAHLRRAFQLDPDQPDTHVAWCQFCAARDDMPGAWGWLRWALDRNPRHDEAANMHGILLHKEGRFAEAVREFEWAEELGNKTAASNRGNSLLDLGRIEEALHAHLTAMERSPESAGVLYNLALTHLRLGDWERGWQEYEARWNFREVYCAPRKFDLPRWRGEPLGGHRILLHAEQGLGDTIQFCRYATLAAARGGRVILQVQEPVARLVASLPAVRAGLAEVALMGEKPPAFDLECPLVSLPAVAKTTVDTVPWQGTYLGAEPELEEAKRRQFPSAPGMLRIGVAWAGNPKYKSDAQRSTHLQTLLPLLRAPGATWFSLQKGPAAEQLSTLPGDVALQDACSHDADLAEAAAMIATLDLVITTDTSVAHLAGAMAKPVWILLPHLADWRWMERRETTPWYPTARLFRQSSRGDWAGVIERVLAELHALHQPVSVPGWLVAHREPVLPARVA